MSAAMVAALFGACTYPEFGFGPIDDTGGGAGGSGGVPTAGQGGEAPAVSSSVGGVGGTVSASSGHPVGGGGADDGGAGSGGVPVVDVPCGDPSTTCAAGQVCCYHDTTVSLDKCAAKGDCGSSYTEFSCNWHDDCDGGAKCCATIDTTFGFFISLKCEAACSGSGKVLLCETNSECSDQTCDDFPQSYPGYKWCE